MPLRVGVYDDVVAFPELTGQEFLRQWVRDLVLDRPLERIRPSSFRSIWYDYTGILGDVRNR